MLKGSPTMFNKIIPVAVSDDKGVNCGVCNSHVNSFTKAVTEDSVTPVCFDCADKTKEKE